MKVKKAIMRQRNKTKKTVRDIAQTIGKLFAITVNALTSTFYSATMWRIGVILIGLALAINLFKPARFGKFLSITVDIIVLGVQNWKFYSCELLLTDYRIIDHGIVSDTYSYSQLIHFQFIILKIVHC